MSPSFLLLDPVLLQARYSHSCVLNLLFKFEISRCKLLCIEWINSKVLLNSTKDYIQYPVINHHGKYKQRMCVCVCVCVCVHIYLNHFALQQKQIQHCKSTILQLKKDCKKSKIAFLTVCHLLRLKAVRVYRLSILLTIIPPVSA